MTEQLKRKIDGHWYYCEKITSSKQEADKFAKAKKYAGFKARVIPLGSTEWGVYVH